MAAIINNGTNYMAAIINNGSNYMAAIIKQWNKLHGCYHEQ